MLASSFPTLKGREGGREGRWEGGREGVGREGEEGKPGVHDVKLLGEHRTMENGSTLWRLAQIQHLPSGSPFWLVGVFGEGRPSQP